MPKKGKKVKGAKKAKTAGVTDESSAMAAAALQALTLDGAAATTVQNQLSAQDAAAQKKKILHNAMFGEDKVGSEESIKHDFWDTQPMAKLNDKISAADEGPVDRPKQPSDVRAEPFNLPGPFEWITFDVQDDKDMQEVYNLLYKNYVEDSDASFRFNYSVSFVFSSLHHFR